MLLPLAKFHFILYGRQVDLESQRQMVHYPLDDNLHHHRNHPLQQDQHRLLSLGATQLILVNVCRYFKTSPSAPDVGTWDSGQTGTPADQET